MQNIKTAISINKLTFERMNALAQKLAISRSRAFALAAEEFIERHRNSEMLNALNAAYDDAPEPKPIAEGMRSIHYNIVKDQW